MAKGIKSIKQQQVVGSSVYLAVDQWLDGTKEPDKTKKVTWLCFSQDKKTPLDTRVLEPKDSYIIKIPPKLAGSYRYYVEASLSGKKDPKRDTGLFVYGTSAKKVVTSKWCTKPDGVDERNSQFSYGHLVYLGLETEGMNGDAVTVEVYRRIPGGSGTADDQYIDAYRIAKIIDGEVNIKMGNTYQWYIKIKNPRFTEEFYVKVKDASGKYISDGKDKVHARYLKIKNKIVSRNSETPTNHTPAKVDKPEVSFKRFDVCKFDTIILSEMKEKETIKSIVFEHGKSKSATTLIYETIAPSSDKNITVEAQGLQNSSCSQKKKHEQKIKAVSPEGKLNESTAALTFPVRSTLSSLNTSPIQYIWPKFNVLKAQESANLYKIYIHSCRYFPNEAKETVLIKAYPDIKWELKFEFGSDLAMEERYKNMAPGAQSKAHYKSGQKSGQNRYRLSTSGKSEVFFGLNLKAVWNNKHQEYEVGDKYVNVIRNFLGVFVKIKEWIDEASHVNKTKDTVAQRLISGIKRVPVTLKFYYPTMSVSGSWWLERSKTNTNRVDTQGSLKLGFTPLIKAEGTLDLLFYAELIPVAGQVIKVLDVAAKISGLEAIFTLTGFGELNVTAEFFDFEFKKANLDFKGKVGLKLELSAKVSGKINAVIFEADFKLEATGTAESYFEPKATIGKDDKGVFLEQQVDWSGLRIVVIIKGQAGKSKTQYKRTFTIVDRHDKLTYGKTYIIQ